MHASLCCACGVPLPLGVHVCFFLGRLGSLHVVCLAEYSSDHPFPKGTTGRRSTAWTNPLGVAHTGSRATCSPPVCLGHQGRTADVVSGVHVRPGQRCSETPPGGAHWLRPPCGYFPVPCDLPCFGNNLHIQSFEKSDIHSQDSRLDGPRVLPDCPLRQIPT